MYGSFYRPDFQKYTVLSTDQIFRNIRFFLQTKFSEIYGSFYRPDFQKYTVLSTDQIFRNIRFFLQTRFSGILFNDTLSQVSALKQTAEPFKHSVKLFKLMDEFLKPFNIKFLWNTNIVHSLLETKRVHSEKKCIHLEFHFKSSVVLYISKSQMTTLNYVMGISKPYKMMQPGDKLSQITEWLINDYCRGCSFHLW